MEWQPIESAPRDREIDLWVVWPDSASRWADAKWMEAGSHKCNGPGNWCSREGFPLHAFTQRPTATHWRDKPPPPTKEQS